MFSKSKKVICLLMALLCMVSIFTDALAPKAEACATVAIAGTYAVIATAMALAGVTAATAAEQWALAKNYATQAQTDVRKQHVIEELSKVIGNTYPAPSGGGNNNEPKPGMLFTVSTNLTLLEHLSSLIDDVMDFFSADEEGIKTLLTPTNYEEVSNIHRLIPFEVFRDATNEELFELAEFGINDSVTLSGGNRTSTYTLYLSENWSEVRENGYSSGASVTVKPTTDGFNVKYGFCKSPNGLKIVPYQVVKYLNTYGEWVYNSGPIKTTNYNDWPSGFPINLIGVSPVVSKVSYNVHKPLDTQPLKDYLSQQEQLDEPTIKPLTIPFPYPWIIIEPDGDIVENPDIDDTPLVPINPTVPDNPEEPTESPTPTPSETPEVAPPLWPSWHDYDEWRRQLFRDIGLNPDAVISPNTTTDPDDAPTVTPDPAAPVEPDVPYKPNIDGMPDIGGTWHYVKDFLADALIWMKLWFSGFLLLPPPIQTSLWALLVITVVLGLLKVFLQ